jgi:hypothetical protein
MTEYATALAAGIALAAACGFRVFLPALVASFAIRAGVMHPSHNFLWLGSGPAVALLLAASLAELAGYYSRWIGHALDALATPASVVAGVVLAAAMFGQMPPAMRWTCAVIVGGGAAATVQAGTVSTRAVLSAMTGGESNRLFAPVEAVGAVAVSILAVVVPILAVVLLAILAAVVVRMLWPRKRSAPAESVAGAVKAVEQHP